MVEADVTGVTGQEIKGYEQDGLKARTPLANGRRSRHVLDTEQLLIPRTEITWDQRRVHSTYSKLYFVLKFLMNLVCTKVQEG